MSGLVRVAGVTVGALKGRSTERTDTRTPTQQIEDRLARAKAMSKVIDAVETYGVPTTIGVGLALAVKHSLPRS